MSKNAQINALTQAVSQLATVSSSALALIHGLSDQLKETTAKLADQGADTEELVSLTNAITENAQSLAQAIEANTPSQPATNTPAAPTDAPEPTE